MAAIAASDQKFVLVAEDDDEIRQLIMDTLKSESEGLNLCLVEAKDGLEAIAHAAKREFHCVITDLRMPRASGEEFLRSLQTQAVNANTPTLVVSGHMDEEFTGRFKNVRSIPKPFQPADLAKAVVREIKLGRLDDRVPVHLVNPFIEACKKLVVGEMGMDPKAETPIVKKAGEMPIGDMHCTLIMTTGPVQARFTLSYDKEWIQFVKQDYFSKRNLQWASLSAETVARQMSTIIFNHVSESLIPIMGGAPRLAGITISAVGSKEPGEINELIKQPGIKISLRTDQGRIIAGAFARSKHRR
ncbi:MAG: response regulator [Bdellovibrionota bacterium]